MEQWRKDAYTKIDQLYKQKCHELDNLFTNKLDEQKKNISEIRSKAADLIREQEVTKEDIASTKSMVHHIQNELNKVEQTTPRIYACSLTVDEKLVQLRELPEYQFNPTSLSTVFKSIKYLSDSWIVLAERDQSLLIHQKPHLCFVNKDLKISKKLLRPSSAIEDICWSIILNQFTY